MSLVRRAWDWLAEAPRQRTGLRVLQVAIALVLLFRVCTEARYAGYFWGPQGLGGGSTAIVLGARLGAVVDRLLFHSLLGVQVTLLALAASAVALLAGARTRLATAVALAAFWALELRMPQLGDGGDNITRLVLGYMLLCAPAGSKPAPRSLAVWLHNLGVLAIALQVLVLYTTSGFMKAAGHRWHQGTALYLISQVEWFSVPGVRAMLRQPFLTAFATYATVLYQVWFPVAMISPLKRVWLLAGILLHASIAMVMGLVTFSTAMIGLELFLLSDAEWAALRERFVYAEPRLVVFFDGACPLCVRTMGLWSGLDVRRALRASSFRDDAEWQTVGVDLPLLEQRMHVRDLRTGRTFAGFAAVCAVARALPLLWPARPILWTLGRLGLGERAYDHVASRRRIRVCDGQCAAVRSRP